MILGKSKSQFFSAAILHEQIKSVENSKWKRESEDLGGNGKELMQLKKLRIVAETVFCSDFSGEGDGLSDGLDLVWMCENADVSSIRLGLTQAMLYESTFDLPFSQIQSRVIEPVSYLVLPAIESNLMEQCVKCYHYFTGTQSDSSNALFTAKLAQMPRIVKEAVWSRKSLENQVLEKQKLLQETYTESVILAQKLNFVFLKISLQEAPLQMETDELLKNYLVAKKEAIFVKMNQLCFDLLNSTYEASRVALQTILKHLKSLDLQLDQQQASSQKKLLEYGSITDFPELVKVYKSLCDDIALCKLAIQMSK